MRLFESRGTGCFKMPVFLIPSLWAVLLLFCPGCENNKDDIKGLTSKNLGVETADSVEINYTTGGNIKARLLSPVMVRVQDTLPYVEFPQKLHVDFYNDAGQMDSRLDARYGKYYEAQSKVFLKDSVKVINALGDTLYCDELWWDRNRVGTEFYTQKPVRIRRRLQIIDGVGMEARQDFKEWHIIDPKGIINIPSAQFPTN